MEKSARQEYMRRWRANNKNRMADWQRRHRLRVSVEEYNNTLSQQNGRCAICKLTPEQVAARDKTKLRYLSVDHCHTTGNNRGLLCQPCNLALGSLKDDILRIESAAAYLKQWS